LASVLVWALVPVGTRFFVQRIDPFMFNTIRFAASGCAALPLFFIARPWRWPRVDLWLLLLCAALSVPGYNIPVALGARSVPAGELGVLIATEPVMIAGLALILQRRPIHYSVLSGSVLALAGVLVTSGVWKSTDKFMWISTLQVLAGAFSWSCYTVLASRLNQRYGTFAATGAIIVIGSVVLLTVSAPLLDRGMLPDGTTVALLGGMGIASSLIGFLLWNFAATRVLPERLGLFLYLIPVVSIGAGAQFLSEALTVQMLLGGALVVVGVWIASRQRMGAPLPVTE
jgi:drug/metabolite transporter (DMT)-like permease